MTWQEPDEGNIFTITPPGGTRSKAIAWTAGALAKILGLPQCAAIYQAVRHHQKPDEFLRAILSALRVRSLFDPEEASKIPRRGGCVVIANHPFGGLDGLVLADLLLSRRPDLKVMANTLLNRIPQLRALTIPVDPFSHPSAARANIGPIRDAIEWVKGGGMLFMFPAGAVSHLTLRHREVADPVWHPLLARVVRHTNATVVPVFFRGRNSMVFQAAGLLHPRLRTVLLVHELLRMRGKCIALKIGSPIPSRWMHRYNNNQELLDYLRWRTYIMAHARPVQQKWAAAARLRIDGYRRKVAVPQASKACMDEIARLPLEQRLAESGPFSVWSAAAAQIPHLLREIGRLRETAFRLAGEGTGKARDLDRFDGHYMHLFVWHAKNAQIAGAYRIGRVDQILARQGKNGLYINTLFESRDDFFDRLGPALELGRSFVHPDYQKSYSPLLLLWKGIGQFIGRNLQYRMLYGPVSISRDYSEFGRRLMATTLLRHSQAEELALMVRPRRPPRLGPVRIRGCRNTTRDLCLQEFKEINGIVADIELGQKEVPVLLRQYLNLGGRLLAFNRDNRFNGVLDGLIVIDLVQAERKTLARYMGPEALCRFLSYHGAQPGALWPMAATEGPENNLLKTG